jgi:hypothetical protein
VQIVDFAAGRDFGEGQVIGREGEFATCPNVSQSEEAVIVND